MTAPERRRLHHTPSAPPCGVSRWRLSTGVALLAAALLTACGDTGDRSTVLEASGDAATDFDSPLGIGRTATAEAIAGWDIDVRPDGQGLPEGSGSVQQGEAVYERHCMHCHGPFGQDPGWHIIAGGIGTLDSGAPLRTVGSYWPHATTLFDYTRRAMPYDRPHQLEADELYAVTAYVLHLNELLDFDAVLDAESLPRVEMPNVDGFIPDPRPDFAPHAEPPASPSPVVR